MRVLSLFDGMACGLTALKRAGIPVTAYYSSEIDKHAIKVACANHPEIIQLGCVKTVKSLVQANVFGKIDLILAGSPCQGFSFAGKQLAFDDPRSALFFDFVEILNILRQQNSELKFLLENVRMKKEHLKVITDFAGVEPHFINSALVSAQNRQRYYWYNWDAKDPVDRGIFLKDILQNDVSEKYLCDKGQLKRLLTSTDLEKGFSKINPHKAVCMTARQYANWKGTFVVRCASIVGRRLNENGVREDYNKNIPITQCLQVKHNSDKSSCLTTVTKDTLLSNLPPGRYPNAYGLPKRVYRRLTPIECERLQTLPDNYTAAVSNTQRYKMLGNGWTVDIIAHLLKGIN